MTMPRKFKCYDCDHEWAVPYGSGQSGRQMVCPKCGKSNLHRADFGGLGKGRDYGQQSRRRSE